MKAALGPDFAVTPTLTFPLHVWQKMLAYVQACPVEVNGFGFIDNDNGNYQVDDVFILKQTASPAGVENEAVDIAQMLYEITRTGGNPGRVKLQWHSHVDMAAYFSTVDLNNIESYNGGNWMVSLVLNKRCEYDARLDIFQPQRIWSPVLVSVSTQLSAAQLTFAQNEIASKVSVPGVFRQKAVKPSPTAGLVTLPEHVAVSSERR